MLGTKGNTTILVLGVMAMAMPVLADPPIDQAPPLREWLSHPIDTRGIDTEGMGALPSDDATFADSASLKITTMRGRPAEVLLTQYLPPIANQGGQQSCVAWSSG